MDRKLKELMAATERDNRALEILELRSKNMKFPSDPSEWLSELERNLPGAESKLPKRVWKEFNELITGQIRIARHFHNRGNSHQCKLTMITISDNWARLKDNIRRESHWRSKQKFQAARRHGEKGGHKPTSRVWMHPLARLMVDATGSAKKAEAWDWLRSQGTLFLEVEDGWLEFEIYIDGNHICAKNTDTMKLEQRAKRTFLDRYYAPAARLSQ